MDGTKHEGGGNPSLHLDSSVRSGSTGGATQEELQRGFIDCAEHYGDGMVEADMPMPYPDEPKHGFLDRPQGWER